MLESTSTHTLSNIFAISKDTARKTEAPYTHIFKEAAERDLETQSRDTKSPRPLIQELNNDEPLDQPVTPSTFERDAPPPPSSDGCDDLPLASLPGNAALLSRHSQAVASPGCLGACRPWQSGSAGVDGAGEPVSPLFLTISILNLSRPRLLREGGGPVAPQLGVWGRRPDCGPSTVKVQSQAGQRWAGRLSRQGQC